MSDDADSHEAVERLRRRAWIGWFLGMGAALAVALVLAVVGITWIIEGSGSDPGRNDDRLDQLEREVLRSWPPRAGRPVTRRVASCYAASEAPQSVTTASFTGTQEQAFAFYEEQLQGRGWRVLAPKHDWETYLQLRKRFSWGYGFAAVDTDGTTLNVRLSFSCL